MPLFGGKRDISLFRHINRELLNKIIETKIGYYKLKLGDTQSNIYGESNGNKTYNDPVLINCLIERGENTSETDDFGPDVMQNLICRFLRDDLAGLDVDSTGYNHNIFPEIGDILLWNDNYYEVDNVNENQFFMGKNPNYSYDSTTDDFGTSLSFIVSCHYTRPEKLGIVNTRL